MNKAHSEQLRDEDGCYTVKNSRGCKCGHTKGEHTAERAKVEGVTYQECLADGCGCECYTRARKA